MILSVIICTYNRSDLLRIALESLEQQDLDASEFEVLVIDNRSQDDTAVVVEQFAQKHTHIHYYLEQQQGLSYARNRGWEEAKGEYVIYIDDDCKLPPGYLSIAKEIAVTVLPTAFTGPNYPFYISQKPQWYKDEYSEHHFGQAARPLKEREYFSGMNMAFQRKLFAAIGGFDPNLGMKGDNLAYGEETEFFDRICRKAPNALIYYDPRFYLYHLVRVEKLRLSWLFRERFSRGRYTYLTFPPKDPRIDPIRHILGFVWTLIALGYELSLGPL